jgi:predicted RNase H-related nuclease YkuK (DUF458 family)
MAEEKLTFSQKQLRDFIVNGYTILKANVGGKTVEYKTLTTKEIFLINTLQEQIIAQRMISNQMFLTLDSLLKLAVGLVSIDGEPLKPELTSDIYKDIVKYSMGFGTSEELKEYVNNIYEKYIEPRLMVILEIPSVVLDEIIAQLNASQEEIKKALQGNEDVEKNS